MLKNINNVYLRFILFLLIPSFGVIVKELTAGWGLLMVAAFVFLTFITLYIIKTYNEVKKVGNNEIGLWSIIILIVLLYGAITLQFRSEPNSMYTVLSVIFGLLRLGFMFYYTRCYVRVLKREPINMSRFNVISIASYLIMLSSFIYAVFIL
ncbi:MAG: hypothetical protein ACK5KQ_00390 [Anaerorhabdus sp.]